VWPSTNLGTYYKKDNIFWTQLKEHPNYDEFWQSRDIIQHLEHIKPAVMDVGGSFDLEDLYSPLETYKNIQKRSDNYNTIVFGPWILGDWARNKEGTAICNVYFGNNISRDYKRDVEKKFFRHFVKNNRKVESGFPEAHMFDTGKIAWKSYVQWPPKNSKRKTFWLQNEGCLNPMIEKSFTFEEFVSDPKKTVPYTEDVKMVFMTRKYVTYDQRFSARRPRVVVFEILILTEDMTLSGEILAKLQVATTGTDADWIKKVVDVFPTNAKDTAET
jgi:putative CocE/NonD family hydrolase